MDDSLLIEEIGETSGDHHLILDWNYGNLDYVVENYNRNNNDKIFYIEMQNNNNDEICMGLTLNNLKDIKTHIDYMIEKLNSITK